MEIQQTQATILLLAIMDLKECIMLDKQIIKAQAYSTIKWEWEVYLFKDKTLSEIFMVILQLFRDSI